MDLIELDRLCRQYAPAEYAADDFNAVAAALAELHARRSRQVVNYAKIGELFGGQFRSVVSLTIVQASQTFTDPDPMIQAITRNDLNSVHLVMLNEQSGILLDSDDRQLLVDQLSVAGNWEAIAPGVTASIKALGVQWLPRWQHHGLASAPTAADCTNAKAEKAAQDLEAMRQADRQVLISNATMALDAVMTLIESEDGTTTPEAMAAAFSTAIGV